MDPRVDSDRDHRNDPTSTYGSSTGGGAYTGQTTSGSTNAGPHRYVLYQRIGRELTLTAQTMPISSTPELTQIWTVSFTPEYG